MPIQNTHEARYAAALVDALLAKGTRLSVYDGEEYPLTGSTDREAILNELGATDEESIAIRDADGGHLGVFYLIYGNSPDELIADHSDNDFCNAIWDDLEAVRGDLP